jgi:hypothetical protein
MIKYLRKMSKQNLGNKMLLSVSNLVLFSRLQWSENVLMEEERGQDAHKLGK